MLCICRVSACTPRLFRAQIGQLVAIFQLLGTPGEEAWGGVSSLPEWSPLFPQFRPRDLAEVHCGLRICAPAFSQLRLSCCMH